jgi:hypothetical protein
MYCERGKLIHIGTYPTIEQASQAYAIAAKKRNLKKQIQKQAHSSDPKRIAHDVVELIRLMSPPHEPLEREEAQRRFEYATQVISGQISIGKGSHAAGASASTDGDEVKLRREMTELSAQHAGLK